MGRLGGGILPETSLQTAPCWSWRYPFCSGTGWPSFQTRSTAGRQSWWTQHSWAPDWSQHGSHRGRWWWSCQPPAPPKVTINSWVYYRTIISPSTREGVNALTLLKGMEYCFRMEGEIMVILCRRKLEHSSKQSGKNPNDKMAYVSLTVAPYTLEICTPHL